MERAPARRASALVRRSESIRVDDCTPPQSINGELSTEVDGAPRSLCRRRRPSDGFNARIPWRTDLRAAARTTSSPPAAPPPGVRLLRSPRKGITYLRMVFTPEYPATRRQRKTKLLDEIAFRRRPHFPWCAAWIHPPHTLPHPPHPPPTASDRRLSRRVRRSPSGTGVCHKSRQAVSLRTPTSGSHKLSGPAARAHFPLGRMFLAPTLTLARAARASCAKALTAPSSPRPSWTRAPARRGRRRASRRRAR